MEIDRLQPNTSVMLLASAVEAFDLLFATTRSCVSGEGQTNMYPSWARNFVSSWYARAESDIAGELVLFESGTRNLVQD